MMRTHRAYWASVAVLSALLWGGVALGQTYNIEDYFILSSGSWWHYTGFTTDEGETPSYDDDFKWEVVLPHAEIPDAQAGLLTTTDEETDDRNGDIDYYSFDANGKLLFHGFWKGAETEDIDGDQLVKFGNALTVGERGMTPGGWTQTTNANASVATSYGTISGKVNLTSTFHAILPSMETPLGTFYNVMALRIDLSLTVFGFITVPISENWMYLAPGLGMIIQDQEGDLNDAEYQGIDEGEVDGVPITAPEGDAPAVTAFNLDGGAATTNDREVTLDNTCTGDPTHYMASEDADFEGAEWQPYATAPTFTLSEGEGAKTVHFKVKNAEAESEAAEDTIDYAPAAGLVLVSRSPADNATGVALDSNLSLTFDDTEIQPGAGGTITIVNVTGRAGEIFEEIPIPGDQESYDGATVTINPAGTFAAGSEYYVLVGAGCFAGAGGRVFPGISTEGAWSFSTRPAGVAGGIPWLLAQQNADGSVGSDYPLFQTAMAVLILANDAHARQVSPYAPAYPHTAAFTAGLGYVLSRATVVAIDPQSEFHDPDFNPDGNGNGEGVYFDSPAVGRRDYSSYAMYETSGALMAIAHTGDPARVVNMPGSAVNGRTLADVAQDTLDFLAWGQTDYGVGRGGWNYTPNDEDSASADQSNAGWAVSALTYAESMGLAIPEAVRQALAQWTQYIQVTDAATYPDAAGGAGYTAPDKANLLRTGNLLQQLAFIGADVSDPRVVAALDYVGRHWEDSHGGDAENAGWRGGTGQVASYHATFCLMKGLMALDITQVGGRAASDWAADFEAVLLAEQMPDGSWPEDLWGGSARILSTEWALLTLQRAVAPTPSRPDLTVPSVSVAAAGEAGTYTVSFSVSNEGSAAAAEAFSVALEKGGAGVETQPVAAGLAAAASSDGAFAAVVGWRDFRTLLVRADSTNAVAELFENNNLGRLPDSDLDGFADPWEQRIVAADPDDAIATLDDVVPGDDFDGDGKTNGEEYAQDTDPTLDEQAAGNAISGRVTDGTRGGLADVRVSAGAAGSALTDAEGYYTIGNVAAGTYDLIPTKGGMTFAPPSRRVTVPPDAPDQDFTGTAVAGAISVPGCTAIYLAGRDDLTVPPMGTDPAAVGYPLYRNCSEPGCAGEGYLVEVVPPVEAFTGNRAFRFSATGAVDYYGGTEPVTGPDGNPNHTAEVEGLAGLSGYTGPAGALVGVFLDDFNPQSQMQAATLDFSPTGRGIGFDELSPLIGQVFFIGDGQTGAREGAAQTFYAPAGATRLFLGIADSANFVGEPGWYDDNVGGFTVTVERSAIVAGHVQYADASPGGGFTVSLGGGLEGTTNADGDYVIDYVWAGTYTAIPTDGGYTYTPPTRSVTVPPDAPAVDFTADAGGPGLSTISGTVMDGALAGIAGVTVSAGGKTAVTDANGDYALTGLPDGTYLVIPSKADQYLFDPPVRQVTIAGANVEDQDFVASAVSPFELYLAGTAAIYLAGRNEELVIPELGGDLGGFPLLRNCNAAPCEGFIKERFPMGITLTSPNEVYTFAARGAVAFYGPGSPTVGPDGNPEAASAVAALDGIGGYNGPAGSLVGVFLDNDSPAGGADPGQIDFSAEGVGTNFTALSPALGQVFFIGNGVAESAGREGVVQQFTAPAGATRVLIGIADAANFTGPPGYYDDNPGAFAFTFNRLSAAFSIGGRITDGGGTGIAGVAIAANGHNTATGGDGRYTVSGLSADEFTVIPSKDGYRFTPIYRRITVGPSVSDANFTAIAVTGDRLPGSSAIFLARRDDVTIPPLGGNLAGFPLGRNCTTGDCAGYVREQFPRQYAADGGDTFTLSASGAVDYYGNPAGGIGPDGDTDSASEIEALAGISGYQGPNGALVGVFYYNANPLWASPPPTLDFTAGGSLGTNFDRLTPALGQVFFIGDGMAQTGGREAVVQEFVAPANATHLYIGIADAQGFSGAPGWYDDNLGDFYVTVSRQLHPTYTIGGQITYAGPRTGAVYVDLLEETFTTGFVPRITATGTGPWIYSFANLDPGTGPGYLRAFMDVDGDGHPGADEPVGVYAGNPLAPLAADVPAADITLTDPPTGQVVITNMWPREGPVLGGNTPTAHVEQASVVAEGAAVDLRVTAALGAPPYHYAWKWVRGADQTTLGGDENPLAFQPGFDTVAHPLAEENTSVVCTVTDSAGRSVATATWNVVRIADTDRDASAPVICTTPDTPRTNDDLLIEVTTDATDPDGDAIAGYAFDWRRLNDNWTYGAATLPAEHTRKGEAWEARARAKTYPYGAADFYSLNAATLQVIIGNTTPAAVVPTNLAVKKNGELAVTLGAQDPDRDDGIDVLTYAIDAMPLHGQIEGFDGAAGTFTYRPNADYVGTDTLWYSVSDGTASSATARVDVLVYGGWLVDIAVQNAALGRVSFGVEEGAMDGLDEGVDELCPPPPPLDVGSICFLAVDQAGVLGLARDIRGQAGPRWLLEVAAADNPVGLSWEGQALPPGDLRIWETDAQGQRLPGGAALAMAATRTLEVPAGQTRYFAIGFAETFTLTLYRGWNLVSLPVDPIDPDVADVFNDHLGRDAEATLRDGDRGVIYSGSVYAWNTPGATGYVQVTTVRALQGYWVYAAVQVDLDVVGIPPGATQLALAAGWNLLGVPQDMDLPAGLPNLVLPVWQWNGSVYEVAGELTRGFGYWFYAREAALIPLTR